MDELKTGSRKGVRCPVSLLKGAGTASVQTIQRLAVMGQLYNVKMTPILVHLVDEAWEKFISKNADSAKLEMILTLEDLDSDTTPLSAIRTL